MIPLLDALRSFGARTALRDPAVTLSGNAVESAAANLAERLDLSGATCVSLTHHNDAFWVVADIACRMAGLPLVPVPSFFSPAQIRHVLETAGVDTSLGDPAHLPGAFAPRPDALPGMPMFQREPRPLRVPPGTARVTFTSGTTGQPKGVCLPGTALDAVAAALSSVLSELPIDRHLAVLPLAVLLENVAGVHAGLMMGAEIVFPGPGDTGLTGSSRFDPRVLIRTLARVGPDSMILLPQMLKALVEELRGHRHGLHPMTFVAVGGARTAPALIEEARALGIAVYEGYGLSECASVVSLNAPGFDRPGSVGRVLPHLDVRVGDDGEILVKSAAPACYVGARPGTGGWLRTGDLGRIDEAGFLHVRGRKGEVLVTSYGRNLSPEWVEGELVAQPGIEQALVLGDGLPGLGALLVARPSMTPELIAQRVAAANADLPDYARIHAWRVVAPFSAARGQLTANGRPRRAELLRCHARAINELQCEIERSEKGIRHDVLPATA